MDAQFKAGFPNLTDIAAKQTSPDDAKYNCIAWAFEDNQRWWWPQKSPFCFWPVNIENMDVLEAFEHLFEAKGWQETTNTEFEAGNKKIALYAKQGVPTHAARLLGNGLWSSKLGNRLDLVHDLADLYGPSYGQIFKIYYLRENL